MAFYIHNPDDYSKSHIDDSLECPFCGNRKIEVVDEDDGYGRHIVRFDCDIKYKNIGIGVDILIGCGRLIELYEDTLKQCKDDYRGLSNEK